MFVHRRGWLLSLGLFSVMVCPGLVGEPGVLARTPVSRQRSDTAVLKMTCASAYIFAGTVVSVDHLPPATPGEIATVGVTFRVEQAVRGPRPGQSLTIREWAGLWEAGDRYRPGERLVLFLYPPSRLGLTSTVGGRSGRIPFDQSGQVLLERARAAALGLPAPTSGLRRQPPGSHQGSFPAAFGRPARD